MSRCLIDERHVHIFPLKNAPLGSVNYDPAVSFCRQPTTTSIGSQLFLLNVNFDITDSYTGMAVTAKPTRTCKTNDESRRDKTSDALSFRHDLSVFVARSLHGVVLSSFIGVRVCFLSSASVFDVQHGDEREKKLKEGAKKKDFLSIFFCPSSFLSAHLFPTQIDP